jgi:hypothetical protein
LLIRSHKCLGFALQQQLQLTKSSQLCLSTLTLLLLLTYPFNIQALSAVTKNMIQGSAPYLTFDGGKTKASTTEGLLGITLSDGTTITPTTNISTPTDPIVLPNAGETFANVGMFVPTSTNSI